MYIGTSDGHVVHVGISETQPPEMNASYVAASPATAITMLGFLSGDRVWWSWRLTGPSTWVGSTRRRAVRLDPHSDAYVPLHSAPVTSFAPSQRVKGFVTGDAKGDVFPIGATSSQTLLRLAIGEFPIRAVAFAPKATP